MWLRMDAVSLLDPDDPGGHGSQRHLVRQYEAPIKNSAPITTAFVNPRGDEERGTSERDFGLLLYYLDEGKQGVASKLKNTREFPEYVDAIGSLMLHLY